MTAKERMQMDVTGYLASLVSCFDKNPINIHLNVAQLSGFNWNPEFNDDVVKTIVDAISNPIKKSEDTYQQVFELEKQVLYPTIIQLSPNSDGHFYKLKNQSTDTDYIRKIKHAVHQRKNPWVHKNLDRSLFTQTTENMFEHISLRTTDMEKSMIWDVFFDYKDAIVALDRYSKQVKPSLSFMDMIAKVAQIGSGQCQILTPTIENILSQNNSGVASSQIKYAKSKLCELIH